MFNLQKKTPFSSNSFIQQIHSNFHIADALVWGVIGYPYNQKGPWDQSC